MKQRFRVAGQNLYPVASGFSPERAAAASSVLNQSCDLTAKVNASGSGSIRAGGR